MLRLLAVVILIGGALAVASGQLDRWTLYLFDPTHTPPPNGLTETTLTTDDGETLVIWSARSRPGKPVVLYFCGNAGNLAARKGRFAAFTARGFGLVAPAYRGSSGTTGQPSQSALMADAAAVAAAVEGLVGPAPVVAYGESLGAAVALALAESHPPAAIVLEAPFASLASMAETLYGSAALARLLASDWDSLERIDSLTAPLLILHGQNDPLVPIAQGRALLEAAASSDKRLIAVQGAGHEDVWQVAAQRALYRFLDRF